jgi:hypothetical protein
MSIGEQAGDPAPALGSHRLDRHAGKFSDFFGGPVVMYVTRLLGSKIECLARQIAIDTNLTSNETIHGKVTDVWKL